MAKRSPEKLTPAEWQLAESLCWHYWHMGVPEWQLRDRVLLEIGRVRSGQSQFVTSEKKKHAA